MNRGVTKTHVQRSGALNPVQRRVDRSHSVALSLFWSCLHIWLIETDDISPRQE